MVGGHITNNKMYDYNPLDDMQGEYETSLAGQAESEAACPPELSNLNKITAAWKMGWSAELNTMFQVVGVGTRTIWIRNINTILPRRKNVIESMKITGYPYAGQLAGNEIPEGQRFRVIKGRYNFIYRITR